MLVGEAMSYTWCFSAKASLIKGIWLHAAKHIASIWNSLAMQGKKKKNSLFESIVENTI